MVATADGNARGEPVLPWSRAFIGFHIHVHLRQGRQHGPCCRFQARANCAAQRAMGRSYNRVLHSITCAPIGSNEHDARPAPSQIAKACAARKKFQGRHMPQRQVRCKSRRGPPSGSGLLPAASCRIVERLCAQPHLPVRALPHEQPTMHESESEDALDSISAHQHRR